ncbi:HAD family hydrolase [Marinimicrobium sp. ABcell2]|uniref:HAD family hydrolase n=1 Tax=Marinimicrobium sp. ABcell2 TaxID=3069751 RepID=UPI0027B4F801|nr:HAD family hydrolase [Marinimicrobium sp. ABcell2]MDQ2078406.1 HAD family hydrolase [Marinimicrobium sp. ABcell2]
MMLQGRDTVLLDMNATFMFGHDRFGENENYGAYFKEIGGTLPEDDVQRIIQKVFSYLEPRFPDPKYRECFPSLDAALDVVLQGHRVSTSDRQRLIATFSHHECGIIPPEYWEALRELASTYQLGLVADIWAPRQRWIEEFERAGVLKHFRAMSFSSDHGIVKPSPKPFLQVLRDLGATPAKTMMIGDSVRRDLGGATAAGLPCILVGGCKDSGAMAAVNTLLDVLG